MPVSRRGASTILISVTSKFQEIADLNTDQSITPAQFNTLKSVFKEALASVAETIFDEYNATRPDTAAPRYFELTSGEPFIPIGLNICWPRFEDDERQALAMLERRFETDGNGDGEGG